MRLRKFRSVAAGILIAALAGCQTTDKPELQTADKPVPSQATAETARTQAQSAGGAASQAGRRVPLIVPLWAAVGRVARPNPLRSLAEIDADARALPTTRDGVYEALAGLRAQRGDGDAAAVAMRYTILGRQLYAVSWMQDIARFNGNSELALLYAETVWGLATAARNLPERHPQADALFELAAEATLLSFVLVAVDGARCVDTTGVEIRLQHLQTINAERLKQMAALHAVKRIALRDRVRQLELNTSLWRREDPNICMEGAREMGRIEATKGTTRIQRPGSPAGRVELVPGPDYLPEYLSPGQQIEAMNRARPAAVDLLIKLLP